MTTTTLAFPDDDPTLRYQAEGLAATTAALQLNGPIKPVPYFTTTDAAPACSVCGDPGRAVDDGTGEPYALCDAGDEAHLSVRETLPALTGDQVRLLRQADRGDLYLGRETGVWFRRSELGRFLVKARPADAAGLHTRGLITATRPVARTRWLAGEVTDAGRALLASAADLDVILSEPYRLWVTGEGPRPAAADQLAA